MCEFTTHTLPHSLSLSYVFMDIRRKQTSVERGNEKHFQFLLYCYFFLLLVKLLLLLSFRFLEDFLLNLKTNFRINNWWSLKMRIFLKMLITFSVLSWLKFVWILACSPIWSRRKGRKERNKVCRLRIYYCRQEKYLIYTLLHKFAWTWFRFVIWIC